MSKTSILPTGSSTSKALRTARSHWALWRSCPTPCGTPSPRPRKQLRSSPSMIPLSRRWTKTMSRVWKEATTILRCAERSPPASTDSAAEAPNKPPVDEEDEPGLEGTDYYSPMRCTFASGIHAAVVETDPDTAEISILRYAVVHDCGTLINPQIVDGQIHGGVAQGVGGALYERMAYDEYGQLQNASFMDFLMPYVTEVPDEIELDHQETPSPLNPLGLKGAGEAGVIPSAAVFASAIEDAEGFPITSMPISPSELYALRLQHSTERSAS